VLAIPSFVVLISLEQPASDIWLHLWRTQILELIGNTLACSTGRRALSSLACVSCSP
jgi:hypothetical protein